MLIFIFIILLKIQTPNKICVIYNYYEKNFIYFLENGILNELDYYIIINGESSVKIPIKTNIRIYYRENKGYDFGAFSYVINKKINKKYDYYFFINTSVKGPYLKDKNIKWHKNFLSLFNTNTHLVGTSINICTIKQVQEKFSKKVVPHVQSMFFVLDHRFLNELKNENFFNEKEINNMNFNDVILNKEINLSQIAINKGYNINSILSKYKGLDYIYIKENINLTSTDGDPYFTNGYFGETIDPYEVIFFKNTRFETL
jgi:hypothetical protein